MGTFNETTLVVSEFIITGWDNVPHQKLVGTGIVIILSLILLCSFTNISIITLSKSLHTPMYFFICMLAVVDILYSSSISLTMLNVLLAEDKRITFGSCIMQHFFYHLGSTMEPCTIALMAYDRLIAISNPLKYHSILTKTHMVLLMTGTWALGCSISGVFTGYVINLLFCRTNILPYCFCEYASLVRAACVDPEFYFRIASIVFTVILLGNFFLIIFSYMKIIYEVVKVSDKDRKKMLSTCSSHLIVVSCFFIPKFLLIVVTRIGLVLTLSIRNGLLICSTLGPSLVNPLVYCLRNKEILSRLQSVLKGSVIYPKL